MNQYKQRHLNSHFSLLVQDDIHLHLDRDNDAYLVGQLINLPSGPRIDVSKHVVHFGHEAEEVSHIRSSPHGVILDSSAISPAVPSQMAVPKEDRIRKPANAWILYRQHHQNIMKSTDTSMTCAELCKLRL